jgi:hypothetical protein
LVCCGNNTSFNGLCQPIEQANDESLASLLFARAAILASRSEVVEELLPRNTLAAVPAMKPYRDRYRCSFQRLQADNHVAPMKPLRDGAAIVFAARVSPL